MNKSKLKEVIRQLVNKVLTENKPAVEPDKETKPGVKEPPVKSPEKPKRRTLKPEKPGTLPDINPKAQGKKTVSENEIVDKIVARFTRNNKSEQ